MKDRSNHDKQTTEKVSFKGETHQTLNNPENKEIKTSAVSYNKKKLLKVLYQLKFKAMLN